MNASIRNTFGTHFVNEGVIKHVFHLEHCEKCGQLLEAPNGTGLVHSVDELKGWGMKELPFRLGELCYDPENDLGTCGACYDKAQAKAKTAAGIKASGFKGDQESGYDWILFSGDKTDDEVLTHFSAPYYGGPGRAFTQEPSIWRTKTRVLVTQYGGLDI